MQGTFDEALFARVAGDPQVALASPVLEASTHALSEQGERVPLRLVGVDALLVRDRALVVAGLEGSLDTLEPKSAIEWLDHEIYPAVTSFQKEVAYGGSEAALIFWFADQRRFEYRQAEQAAYWKCSAAHGKHEIPIGRCLWNGSEPNSQEIREKTAGQARFAGYYLQRIS